MCSIAAAPSLPSHTLAHHKLEVSVLSLIVGVHFGFDSDDLLVSSNQHWCHCAVSVSNFKQQSVVDVEKLESVQITSIQAVHFNFPGLLARLWHHEVLHWHITLLLSALRIARDEVVSAALTTKIVLKSCKKEIFGSFFDEVSQHGFVGPLNFLVLVVGRGYFVGKRDVFIV